MLFRSVREICGRLAKKDIRTKPFWQPVYMQKPYVQAERSGMDVTGKLWKHILPLPASTCLTDEQLEDVVMAVKEIL